MTWNVSNNQIYGFANFGVDVVAGGSATAESGAVNATVTGNTIANPAATGGFPTNGLQFNIGTVPPRRRPATHTTPASRSAGPVHSPTR